MSATCPVCCQGQIVSESWQQEFKHQGVALFAEYTEEFCDACGTLLQSPKTVRENSRNKQRVKNSYDGLLDGSAIRDFREKYAITQKQAAGLFGGGPTAFAKYEVDEIAHNAAMDKLLRLAKKSPRLIFDLAELALVDLSPETQNLIHLDLEASIAEPEIATLSQWQGRSSFNDAFNSVCANDNSYKLSFEKYEVSELEGVAA